MCLLWLLAVPYHVHCISISAVYFSIRKRNSFAGDKLPRQPSPQYVRGVGIE